MSGRPCGAGRGGDVRDPAGLAFAHVLYHPHPRYDSGGGRARKDRASRVAPRPVTEGGLRGPWRLRCVRAGVPPISALRREKSAFRRKGPFKAKVGGNAR